MVCFLVTLPLLSARIGKPDQNKVWKKNKENIGYWIQEEIKRIQYYLLSSVRNNSP